MRYTNFDPCQYSELDPQAASVVYIGIEAPLMLYGFMQQYMIMSVGKHTSVAFIGCQSELQASTSCVQL